MIDHKSFTEAVAQQREAEKCKHPTEAIRDLPNRSYCTECDQDVPPLMRDKPAKLIIDRENDRVIWDRGSPFNVFPNGE